MKSRSYTQVARADTTADTRDRIAAAAAELFRDNWYEDVTLAAIARAAGVSHQTVLNHLESKEGVALAAATLVGSQTTSRRERVTPGDVVGAVRILVAEYERIGDSNARWAFFSERLGSLSAVMDEARAGHQLWLERVFHDQLPTDAAGRRRGLLALHAATDVYVWRLLRRDLGASRGDTERSMAALVRGVLTELSPETGGPA